MKTVNVLVLKAPGTNCDAETVTAWQATGAKVTLQSVSELIRKPNKLKSYHVLTLPGGFSYGDDLGAGKIHALDLVEYLQEEFFTFVRSERLVLGICNGFQSLVKTGLIPDITLYNNDSGKFECRWVYCSSNNQGKCVFTKNIKFLHLPIAHGEGKLVVKDEKTLKKLEKKDQIVMRYANRDGTTADRYPSNPNGSAGGVAGICNEEGNVFGLMPHPERASFRYQLPHWLRGDKDNLGLKIFQNAYDHFQ